VRLSIDDEEVAATIYEYFVYPSSGTPSSTRVVPPKEASSSFGYGVVAPASCASQKLTVYESVATVEIVC